MLMIDITKAAFDFLMEMQVKPFRQVMLNILQLTKNPQPQDAKKLVGYEFFRIDIGEYRVIYQMDESVLKIILVGKRNDDDVYRRLKNIYK